ncbi:MAG: hypothetical protein K9G62_05545 [Alphaproteobacteria bacterium]|nr:hypothetical protein [Alphaproteobacteria bacterium]
MGVPRDPENLISDSPPLPESLKAALDSLVSRMKSHIEATYFDSAGKLIGDEPGKPYMVIYGVSHTTMVESGIRVEGWETLQAAAFERAWELVAAEKNLDSRIGFGYECQPAELAYYQQGDFVNVNAFNTEEYLFTTSKNGEIFAFDVGARVQDPVAADALLNKMAGLQERRRTRDELAAGCRGKEDQTFRDEYQRESKDIGKALHNLTKEWKKATAETDFNTTRKGMNHRDSEMARFFRDDLPADEHDIFIVRIGADHPDRWQKGRDRWSGNEWFPRKLPDNLKEGLAGMSGCYNIRIEPGLENAPETSPPGTYPDLGVLDGAAQEFLEENGIENLRQLETPDPGDYNVDVETQNTREACFLSMMEYTRTSNGGGGQSLAPAVTPAATHVPFAPKWMGKMRGP